MTTGDVMQKHYDATMTNPEPLPTKERDLAGELLLVRTQLDAEELETLQLRGGLGAVYALIQSAPIPRWNGEGIFDKQYVAWYVKAAELLRDRKETR